MHDIHIVLKNAPGELAWLNKILALNGIGVEGGCVLAVEEHCHVHFLVGNGHRTKAILESEGVRVLHVQHPLIVEFKQDRLGEIAAALSRKGVNVLAHYCDRANQLIFITDNEKIALQATELWAVQT
ncbi:amino acid-binding protein [Obesumbacterium proteus]|uniref:amino acid-binding protein n=2 Tax=Obesumbacterium proteus TaxID=82983 RepID=UPI001F42B285|nr:amino acid-binding protein [Obesumbacterium proteus]MCE9885159.1 amino acid-binding protein [Obesumbacterium proteus]MCE9914231.1 amino acid-binding protein [Obesumbacterium proteus]MCE9929329.1 amino acid-binding protein [Obesumbacterium proteus]